MRFEPVHVLQVPAQMGHFTGDGAAQRTRSQSLVDLAVQRQRHLVPVAAAADAAAERIWRQKWDQVDLLVAAVEQNGFIGGSRVGVGGFIGGSSGIKRINWWQRWEQVDLLVAAVE